MSHILRETFRKMTQQNSNQSADWVCIIISVGFYLARSGKDIATTK
jgi:hypothetical protein